MICAVCGKGVRKDPVWVEYGDKPGRGAFPLHPRHYPEGGMVTVSEWVNNKDGDPELREFTVQRYVRVEAPTET